ncbi:hypothetical protein ACSLNR_27925, partial [Escherichia coli]
MRVLVRIVTSTVYDVFPLFMVKVDGHNDRRKEQQREWDGLHAATSLITSNAELNTSTIAKAFMTTS